MEFGPKTYRFFLNLYPPYLFSRTVVKSISPDWRHITVVLKKSWLTRNYVGTTFGGSLFAATDPFYMIMLIKVLGIKDYIVWDQGAEINYIQPARSHVHFEFHLSDAQIKKIHQALEHEAVYRPTYWVEGKDVQGQTVVKVRKDLYIRKKDKTQNPNDQKV